MSDSIDVPLAAVRNAIRADWARRAFRNERSNVDVAIVQHFLGLSREADGLMGYRTRERIINFLDGKWQFSIGDAIPPDEIFDPMSVMSGHLAVRLGSGRDIEVAMLQAVLKLPLTGLLGPVTYTAALMFIETTWCLPGPVPPRPATSP